MITLSPILKREESRGSGCSLQEGLDVVNSQKGALSLTQRRRSDGGYIFLASCGVSCGTRDLGAAGRFRAKVKIRD